MPLHRHFVKMGFVDVGQLAEAPCLAYGKVWEALDFNCLFSNIKTT